MKREIVILANSRKRGNRCIAGIDIKTGEWVRPCFRSGDDGIPKRVRQVEGNEPELLDILSIPLANTGPHLDFQPENRQLLRDSWQKVGKATAEQILKCCAQNDRYLLHNAKRLIHIDALLGLPARARKSLCLFLAHAKFSTEKTFRGNKRVNASFKYGSHKYCLPVTDYNFESRFPDRGKDEADCFLTVSLGSPFERDKCCYKFVAGVIKLRKNADSR